MQISEIAGPLNFTIPVAGQGTAATPDEFVGILAPFNAKVTRALWVPKASITANASNYFTLTLRNRKRDGTGTAHPAQRAYSAGNSTALVPEDMTLSSTASDLLMSAGDALTVEKLVTGTGLAMPAGTVQVWLQWA